LGYSDNLNIQQPTGNKLQVLNATYYDKATKAKKNQVRKTGSAWKPFRVFRIFRLPRHSFSDGGWFQTEVATQVFFRVLSHISRLKN
jgi:hypothetical protein